MDTLKYFLSEYPLIQEYLKTLTILLPLLGMFAFAGMGFLGTAGRILAKKCRRTSYDKGSRQIVFFGLFLGWFLVIGVRLWLFYMQRKNDLENIPPLFTEIVWILLVASVLALSLYYAVWKQLSKHMVLHAVLGILSSVLGLATTLATLSIAKYATLVNSAVSITELAMLMPAWTSCFWPISIAAIPLCLAMPAACGAIWLLLIRSHEDFGRDHYNTMLLWCANWASTAWIVVWLLFCLAEGELLWPMARSNGLDMTTALNHSFLILLWLTPVILWTIIRHSAFPLRHKLTFLSALLIVAAFLAPYLELLLSL